MERCCISVASESDAELARPANQLMDSYAITCRLINVSSKTKSLRATSRETPSEQRLRRRQWQRQDVFFTPARHRAQADHRIGESTEEVQTPLPSSLLARRSCNFASAAPTKEPVCFVHGVIASFAIQSYPKFQGPQAQAARANLQARAPGPLTTAGMDAPEPLSLPTWPSSNEAKPSRGRRTELPPAPTQSIEARAATCPRLCIQSTGSSPSCD